MKKLYTAKVGAYTWIFCRESWEQALQDIKKEFGNDVEVKLVSECDAYPDFPTDSKATASDLLYALNV